MAMPNNISLLRKQILPEIEISCNANGIVISSERISVSRFLPFDKKGRCNVCKSSEVEVDYAVTKEGVTVWCNRFVGTRFVPVDIVREVPGCTFIKIKNKARVFNVDCGEQAKMPVLIGVPKQQHELIDLTSPSPSPDQQQSSSSAPILQNEDTMHAEDAHAFLNSIGAATHFLEYAQNGGATVVPVANNGTSPMLPNKETMHAADAQEFVNSVSAATHTLDFAQSGTAPATVQPVPTTVVEGEPSSKKAKVELDDSDYAEIEEFMNSVTASAFGLDFPPQTAVPSRIPILKEELESDDDTIPYTQGN